MCFGVMLPVLYFERWMPPRITGEFLLLVFL